MWKFLKRHSGSNPDTGSDCGTDCSTCDVHTASDFHAGTEADWRKTSTAKFVYLTNSTKGEIREIYLRAAGGTEWGKNLIPAESTIKDAEQVQMYYTPDSATDAIYDMKVVDGDGNAYEIYSAELGDMEKAKL